MKKIKLNGVQRETLMHLVDELHPPIINFETSAQYTLAILINMTAMKYPAA